MDITTAPKAIGNRPADFAGTPEEAAANYASHWFDPEYDRCMNCDCRPWGRIASWPCGTDVPRAALLEGEPLFPGRPEFG